MFSLRSETLDEYIYQQVVECNEYSLPDSFSEVDIVVDVGAHIGTFAFAALQRGARRVYCIEADLENLEIAKGNLQTFIDQGWVTLIHGAAWRSDANDDVLYFEGYQQMGSITNTGGGRVLKQTGKTQVQKINFDAFLSKITSQGKERVRFLKLDCEGSEWPILMTSKMLHLVDEIHGEIHEICRTVSRATDPATEGDREQFDELAVEDLIDLLTKHNFEVEYSPYWFKVPYFERLGILSAIQTTIEQEQKAFFTA